MKYNLSLLALIMISAYAYAETSDVEYSTGIRVGTQYSDDGVNLALGGNIHVEKKLNFMMSLGATVHTTNALFNQDDEIGIPFYNATSKSYSILSEVYLSGEFEDTKVILGRQTIDTPFLDSDDIGMVPNTFEAYTLMHNVTKDMSLLYTHVRSMSGVDAEVPESFSDVNGKSGLHIIGLMYEPTESLSSSGWFYHIPGYAKFSYLDAVYEDSYEGFNYALGGQVALQDFNEGDSSKIFGFSALIAQKESALSLFLSYNKVFDEAAVNGFGGGGFFANDEHMTLAEVGRDGEIFTYGIEWDTSEVLREGFTMSIMQSRLKDEKRNTGDETDVLLSYEASDRLSFDAVYSTLDNRKISGDKFENLRAFCNYSF